MNSDPEDEVGKKLVSLKLEGSRITIHGGVFSCSPADCLQAPGKYTVVADCEKAGPQELSVKSGDIVQLIREGEEGQW